MYKEHSTFIIDKTKGLPLWRYMDFWKFLDLLNRRTLFFPNVEMLGDQHEGRVPLQIIEAMQTELGTESKFTEMYKNHIENNMRRKILISSWSANQSESFAMWKMYAKEKLGIGIRTDIDSLRNAFNSANENIYIGEVFYYDKMDPVYDVTNAFYNFLNKHKYYEFEQEVRCITELPDESKETFKNIPVDLNILIKEIYVSPFAYETGLMEIIEFLKNKHGLSFGIEISGVNDKWI